MTSVTIKVEPLDQVRTKSNLLPYMIMVKGFCKENRQHDKSEATMYVCMYVCMYKRVFRVTVMPFKVAQQYLLYPNRCAPLVERAGIQIDKICECNFYRVLKDKANANELNR